MNETQKTLDYIKTHAKEGIQELQNYLSKKQIILAPLAQKMGGKTYYIQFFTRAVGTEFFETISVGDIFRELKATLTDQIYRKNFEEELSKHFDNTDKIIEAITDSTSSKLVPDGVTFYLVQQRINEVDKNKSIILDGIPRTKEQIKYVKKVEKETGIDTFFFYFDTEYEVLDIRAESRRVCPKCKLDLNIISMPSSKLIYKNNEVIMLCDNCNDSEMVKKPGDESIEEIKKARIAYEDFIQDLKTEVGEKLIWVKTCIPINEYEGPMEEVNKDFKYELKGDTVLPNESYQITDTKLGKVYVLSPEYVSRKIIEEIANRLSTLP